MSSGRIAGAIALALIGALISGLLLLHHHGEEVGREAASVVCSGDEAVSGCDVVNQSAWAEIGGVPLAGVGMVFYLAVALLLLLGLAAGAAPRDTAAGIAFAGIALALGVDLVLLGVQAFSLHAFCKLCLATYGLNAVALAFLWPARRALAGAPAIAKTAEGRVLVVGWLAGGVAFALTVAMAEATLEHRASERAAAVLGAPLPPPSAPPPAMATTPVTEPEAATTAPALAAPGSGEDEAKRVAQELKVAQEEVKRLQAVLDDPQKLERFFADKSLKEFEASKAQSFDLKETPFKGPASAPIKVVEYADFLCPFCRNLSLGLGQYLPMSAERVAVYFRHFPLDAACNPFFPKTVHEGACWLAQGGVCAQEQGKFWPYHDKVYRAELKTADREVVVKLAGEAGLDAAAFETCIVSPRTKEQVVADIKAGKEAGVAVTPTLYINGKKLPRMNEFLEAVDTEAKRLGLSPMPSVGGAQSQK